MDRTELCNAALAHLGQWSISDYDDQTPTAEVCRRSWNACRRSSLRAFHWNFALQRAALSEDAAVPQHGYDHAFVLPSDYLMAVQVNGISAGTGGAEFSIEGGRVLTNDTAVNLWYVRDVETVSAWDDSFAQFFTYRLAAAVAPAISGSSSISESLEQRALAMLAIAKGHDSVESRPHVVRGSGYSGYAASRGNSLASSGFSTSSGSSSGSSSAHTHPLSALTQSGATTGQAIVWSGTAWVPGTVSGGSGTGTVTSVAASGGTTGLSFTGSPITTSGTLTLSGTLEITNGGTGATSASAARTALGLVIGTDVLAPNGSGASLTALNASALASGTVPDARFPATLPAASGVNLTALNASAIASGTVPAANLGSGVSISTKYLRGDNTWQTIAGGGDALTSGNLSQFAATTSAQLAGVISDETGSGALVFAVSPALTGTPTAPTAAGGTNTTQIATTAFVQAFTGTTAIVTLGTITTGTWNGTVIGAAYGGTGRASHTAYGVICGGTTGTGAQQSIASVGTAGQVLTSNGAGALPTFQNAGAGSSPTTTRGDLIRRGASADERLALGSMHRSVMSDGTDPVWGVTSEWFAGVVHGMYYVGSSATPSTFNTSGAPSAQGTTARVAGTSTVAAHATATSAATTASLAGVNSSAVVHTSRAFEAVIYGGIDSLATTRFFAGFFGNVNTMGANDSPSGTTCIAVRYSSNAGDTNWQLVTSNGATATVQATSIAATTGIHKFTIRSNGASSMTFWIDDVYAGEVTTTLPAASIAMGVIGATLANVAIVVRHTQSYCIEPL